MTFVRVALFVLFGLAAPAMAQPALTETSIAAMAEAMEEALEARDLNAYMAYFADDALLVIDMPDTMGGQQRMDVAEYRASIAASWALPLEYTHETRNMRIQVADDGASAIVTDVVFQQVHENGKLIWASSMAETAEIVLVDGEPKVSKVLGRVTPLNES